MEKLRSADKLTTVGRAQLPFKRDLDLLDFLSWKGILGSWPRLPDKATDSRYLWLVTVNSSIMRVRSKLNFKRGNLDNCLELKPFFI